MNRPIGTTSSRYLSPLWHSRSVLAVCGLILFAAAFPCASQSLDDIDFDGNQTLNTFDLIALLESDPPPFPKPDLLFLLAASWADEIAPQATPTPTLAGGPTFNMRDYFPIDATREWNYVGFRGATFAEVTNMLLLTSRGVFPPGDGAGGTLDATRFSGVQLSGIPDHHDPNIDHYFYDESNDLFFFPVNDQDIGGGQFESAGTLVKVGGDGLSIGDEVGGVFVPSPPSKVIEVVRNIPTIGVVNILVDEWESRWKFTEFLPFMDTPLGRFNNVLRVEVFMRVKFNILGVPFDFVVKDKTIFLKEGIGMIAQDPVPDPDDVEIQAISEGRINGVFIQADIPAAPDPTETPTRTSTITETPTVTETPTPTITETPTPTIPTTFDILDYFITSPDSTWHYSGIRGATDGADFRRRVDQDFVDLGAATDVRVFRTVTDVLRNERNGNFEYWRPFNNQLFYFGGNGVAGVVGGVTLTNPILIGGTGIVLGQELNDTGSGVGVIGGIQRNLSVTSSVKYTDVFETFETPLGTFRNILRVEVFIEAENSIGPFTNTRTLFESTLFLKEGVGIIAQDYEPDPDDLEIQAIDSGTVLVGDMPVEVMPP